LLSSINRGEEIKSETVSFYTTKQLARKGTITADATSSATALVVNPELYARVTEGYILMIGDELVKVTAKPSANTLTVVRGIASTPSSAITAPTEISILNKTEADGKITEDFLKLDKVESTNVVQEFTKDVLLSTRSRIYSKKDYMNVLAEESIGKMDEMGGDIETGLFYGRKLKDRGTGTGNEGRNLMGGLKEAIINDGGVTADMQGAVTEKKFENALLGIAEKNGTPPTIYMNAVTKNVLYNAFNNVQKTVNGINPKFTGGAMISGYVSDSLGYELKFVVDNYLKNGDVFVLNEEDILLDVGVHPDDGEDILFRIDKDDEDSSKTQRTIRSIITTQFRNAYKCAYIAGVTA
jgi:hypothetical protein